MNDYQLKTYYIKYLKEIRKVSDSTVNHYQDALNYISKFLAKKGKIEQSLYEIQNYSDLEIIKEYLFNDVEFIALNSRGHQMYSSALNNYLKFANGSEFSIIKEKIEILDTKIKINDRKKITISMANRSEIIKNQSIESANYSCEMDSRHLTFTSNKTKHQYMEGHHAIPIKYQDKFDNNLDVYANIVCLCPICHRLLHFGIDSEKKDVIKKIYFDRADRLAKSGLTISENDFRSFITNNH